MPTFEPFPCNGTSAEFRAKGVIERDIGEFLKNNGLPNKLDLVLKLLYKFDIKSATDLWEGFRRMNNVRNGVVHAGEIASDTDAEKAIDTSKKVIELIGSLNRPS